MARNRYDIDEEGEVPFDPHYLKRLSRYLVPHKKNLTVAIILMLSASLVSLAGPYLTKLAIDEAIPRGNVRYLAELAALFLTATLFNSLCQFLRMRLMAKLGQRVIRDLRSDLFRKLQSLPFAYFDSRPHGKILIRVVNYVNSLSDLISNGLLQVITDLFTLVFILVFMFIIDVRLTLICMAGLPLMVGAIFLVKKTQHNAWQKVSHKQANLNAYLQESLSGMKITQSFARERTNRELFHTLGGEWKKSWMWAVTINSAIWPVIDNISTIGASLVYVAGISWFAGTVSVGTLVAFVGYIWRFWRPIQNIGNFYNSLVTAGAYLQRIYEMMDEPVMIEDAVGARELPTIRGHVAFEDVTFSYDRGNPVLRNVGFEITPGMSVAIVGPTGAGKTTIVNLLSRFYTPDSGRITIDGIDLGCVTMQSLRAQVGVMLQDSFLFSGTIMDNIRYGKLDATDDEVVKAAKVVHAHSFIMGLQDGYNTVVNERGSRLSVGQRQLVSFARVLLADPRVLILDEATSSVDTETERAIQAGLEKLLTGRTSFIIAHRLSTIEGADRIFFINHGTILEEGTHAELEAKKGAYWSLYASSDK